MNYIISKEELIELIYESHDYAFKETAVEDFLKSKQSVELVAEGRIRFTITNLGKLDEERFSTYINREDITDLLEECEGSNIKIYIQKVKK